MGAPSESESAARCAARPETSPEDYRSSSESPEMSTPQHSKPISEERFKELAKGGWITLHDQWYWKCPLCKNKPNPDLQPVRDMLANPDQYRVCNGIGGKYKGSNRNYCDGLSIEFFSGNPDHFERGAAQVPAIPHEVLTWYNSLTSRRRLTQSPATGLDAYSAGIASLLLLGVTVALLARMWWSRRTSASEPEWSLETGP